MIPRTLVLHLAEHPGGATRWELWEGGTVRDSGDAIETCPPPAEDLAAFGVAPAAAVTIHQIDLPDLAPNQARVAAALLAAEASATPVSALHIALGARDQEGQRLMAVVDAGLVEYWLTLALAAGHQLRALVPAPLLLPVDPSGFTTACVGGLRMLRSIDAAFAEDALTPIMIGDAAVRESGPVALDAALRDPPLDLRQGRFALRRQGIDRTAARRIALLSLAALALTIVTLIVQIIRFDFAADAAQARASTAAAAVLPRGSGPADRALTARLAALEGPGGGLPGLITPVVAVLERAPAIDMRRLDYRPDGSLFIELSGPDAAQLSAAANAIQARGVRVTLGASGESDGRTRAEFTVRRQ